MRRQRYYGQDEKKDRLGWAITGGWESGRARCHQTVEEIEEWNWVGQTWKGERVVGWLNGGGNRRKCFCGFSTFFGKSEYGGKFRTNWKVTKDDPNNVVTH